MKTERITRKAALRVAWVGWALCALYWIALSVASDWPDSAQHRVPRLDEAANLRAAAALRAGEWMPPEGYVQPPAMRWLLAPLTSGRVPGDDFALAEALPLRMRLAHVLAWLTATGLLLLGATRGLWPLASPLLLAATSTAALSVMRPLPEIWILAVCAAQVLAMRRGWVKRQGVLVAIAVLFRGSLVALLLPSLWQLRRRRAELVALLASFLLALLPVVLAQSLHLGRPAGPSLNAGINLYIGNGDDASGLFRTGKGYNFAQDPTGRAWLAQLGIEAEGDASDVDRAWTKLTLRQMGADPLRSALRGLQKLRYQLIWSELPQISSWNAWTRAVPGLQLFALPFGLLVVLACAGLPALRERGELRPIAALLLALLCAHALFFVAGRFRVALLPALCILGGHGLVLLWRRRALAWAFAIAGALTFAPWGMEPIERSLRSGTLIEEGERHRLWAMHLGPADERAGHELERARKRFDDARALTPRRAEIYRALARLAILRGDREAAIELLGEGLRAGADPAGLEADLLRLRGAER